MQTDVITIAERSKWNDLIFRCQEYDFYHCHSYCALEQSGRPLLFTVADDGGDFIAFPLVLRPIPGSRYHDCTSVYGYPGPVSNKTPDTLSPELIYYFHISLLN